MEREASETPDPSVGDEHPDAGDRTPPHGDPARDALGEGDAAGQDAAGDS